MSEPIQPIVPEGTPLPTPPVGVPPFPITPFSVWTWSTPVIPNFYWNIYSAEQRIKAICKEIGRIEAYLQYLVDQTNKNFIEVHQRIDRLTERVAQLERHVEEEVARLDDLIAQLRADLEKEIADREAADEALGDRIDQEINDRQAADNVLHGEIAQEVEDRIHADDALHSEISQEVQNRIHADDALGARIDAEAQARQAADASLHSEIAAEATARAHGDEALHQEISTETSDRIHADTELEAKLEAELQAEADIRQEGDTALRESISKEETDRKAADAALGQRITQEIADRESGDQTLETKIDTEAHEREAGDDQLANDLEAETDARREDVRHLSNLLTEEMSEREAADTALEAKIAKRLLPSEVLAGDEIAITKDPDSNVITISSTVAHSISELETLITGLQSALTAETAERRADDANLWTAVNERIERGKILAGAGIKVANDPDSSTVTISATSTIEGGDGIKVETEGDKSTVSLSKAYPVVTGGDAVTVDWDPGEGDKPRTYTVSVNTASKESLGVITEDRVRELAPKVRALDPLRITENTPEKVVIGLNTTQGGAECSQTDDKTAADISLLVRQFLAARMIIGALPTEGVREDVVPQGGVLVQAGYTSERSIEELSAEEIEELSPEERTVYRSGVWVGVATGQGLEIGDYDSGEKGRLRAKTATEEEAGIISESRVKELAGEVAPNLSAKSPLKLEDGQLSATPYPTVEGEGPVTVEARSASRPGVETGMTFSVGVNPATENEAGVITEARVKELIAEALAAQAQNPTE